MSDYPSNAHEIIEAARAAVDVIDRPDENLLVLRKGFNPAQVIDLQQWADHPRRATGHTVVTREQSFVDAVRRWVTPATVVYAIDDAFEIVAVLDDHADSEFDGEPWPGWREHRVHYPIPHGESWKAWTGIDRTWLAQAQFVDFLEENVLHVEEPPSGELLSIVADLRGVRTTSFTNVVRLADGTQNVQWAEEQTAKGKGSLDMPERITLLLEPVRGSDLYRVGARLQYRVNEHGLAVRVLLERTDDVLRVAFEEVVNRVERALNVLAAASDDAPGIRHSNTSYAGARGYDVPVLYGTP